MAKIWMDDKVGRDKFDPYKDTLVTTVRGTEEEVKEVLDKLMGDETNKIERNTVSLRQKWISVKERMPDANQIVILCGHKIYSDAQFVLMRQVDGYGVFENSTDDIFTHWMLLPDAPEVEDE